MAKVGESPAAQALRWLKEHGGDGMFDKNGVVLAGGELAPFRRIARECWLLLEAMWPFSGRAAPHLAHCTDIVPAGRMKIFEGSDHSGRKAFAWHRFVPEDGQHPRLWPVGVVPDA